MAATTTSNGFEEVSVYRSISTFLIILAPFKSFWATTMASGTAVDDIAIACLREANELVALVQCSADNGLAEDNGATAGDGVGSLRASGSHRNWRFRNSLVRPLAR